MDALDKMTTDELSVVYSEFSTPTLSYVLAKLGRKVPKPSEVAKANNLVEVNSKPKRVRKK